MQYQSGSEKEAAITVVSLLILTAWGNAVFLISAAVVGWVVLLFAAQKILTRGSIPVIVAGFMVAILIALLAMNR